MNLEQEDSNPLRSTPAFFARALALSLLLLAAAPTRAQQPQRLPEEKIKKIEEEMAGQFLKIVERAKLKDEIKDAIAKACDEARLKLPIEEGSKPSSEWENALTSALPAHYKPIYEAVSGAEEE